MKTYTTKKENHNSEKNYSVVVILITSLLIMLSLTIYGQGGKPRITPFGLSANATLSGAGFGSQYNICGSYHFNNSTISAGPVFQHRNGNYSGINASYEYTLFDGSAHDYDCYNFRKLELNSFITTTFHHNAILGNKQLRTEKKVNPESAVNYGTLKYTAIEAYVGFGLNLRISSRFKWTNAIGFGGWTTLKGYDNVYREKQCCSIMLRSGFSYQF